MDTRPRFPNLARAALACALSAMAAPAGPAEWWNGEWPYRVSVTVMSGLYDRADCLVSVPFDLGHIGKKAGIAGGIDVDSLRVIEVTDGLARETPSAYRTREGSAGPGLLIWSLSGETPSMSERCYHVYFDGPGRGRKPARSGSSVGTETAWGRQPVCQPRGPDTLPAAWGENLVPNANFEKVDEDGQPVGWKRIRRAKDTIGKGEATRREAHTGSYSLHVAKPEDKGKSCVYSYHGWRSPIPAKPSAKYRFSGWAKATGKNQHCIGFHFLADEWKSTRTRAYKIVCGQGAHDWQELAAVAVAPEDAKYIHVQLYIFSGSGDAYFDNVEVKQIPMTPPPKAEVGRVEVRR